MEPAQPTQSRPGKTTGIFRAFSRPAVLCLLLTLAIVAVYWPVGRCEFLNYDDPDYVTANPWVLRGVTADGVVWALTTSHADNWHPLTWISHMLDADLFGPGAAGPHLVNLLFHVANTLLLFLALRRLTGALWRSALVAALFGLHPLHVESVAWVSERKDVLSTFFALLALWFYARYAKRSAVRGPRLAEQGSKSEFRAEERGSSRPAASEIGEAWDPPGNLGESEGAAARDWPRSEKTPDSRKSALDYLFVLLFFALALLSKPMVVTLPFVMLLLDYWPLRRTGNLEVGSEGEEIGSRPSSAAGGRWLGGLAARREAAVWRRLLLEKMPLFALSALSSLVTYFVQRRGGAVVSLAGLTLSDRIENALVSYARYVGKMFWPSRLVLPYPHPGHWPWQWVAWGAAVTLGGCSLAVVLRRRWPFVFTGWFWFFGTLIPVIGLVQVGHQSLADRYTYVPLIGLFVAGIWGVAALAFWARIPTPALGILTVLALAVCGARTAIQLRYWQDSGTLFRHALACSNRNYMAHDYLGGYLEAQGKWNDAIQEFQAALGLNARDAVSYAHLGVCHFHRGDPTAARQDYQRALELDPQSATTWINLGVLDAGQGHAAEAEQDFKKALELEPDSGDALERLAETLVAEQKYREAIPHYESALRLRSGDAELWIRLGNALFNERQFSDAGACYETALQLHPNSVQALSNLGAVQFELGKFADARRSYERALELAPANAQAHNNLANVLFRENRLDDAEKEYQRALEADPRLAEALNNLGWLRAQKEDYSGALDCFERASRLRPADESIQLHRAFVLARLGRDEEARHAYEEALRLNPRSAEAHFGLATLEARLNHRDEAIRQASEALRIRPDYDDAKKLLNTLGDSPMLPTPPR